MGGTDSKRVELAYRIRADIDAYAGVLPERHALAWHGYLAGVLEWGVIDFPTYSMLVDLLPRIGEPDPILTIFLGRDEQDSRP